jgi:hypothetical protein
MKVVSKDTYKLIPVLTIVVIASLGLLFLIYIILDQGEHRTITFELVSGLLFLSWIVIIPLVLLVPMFRSIEFFQDRLQINYLFGTINRRHFYDQLRLSRYRHQRGNGIVIESDNGDQITFGEKEYNNYDSIKELLENRIKTVNTIELKYLSRTLVIMLILFGLNLIVFIISMKA